jgi:hypothetical protein
MRNLTLAIAVLLVCAASLALAEGSRGTQPVEPSHDAQTAPGAPNPPKAENVPSVAKVPSATANIPSNPPSHFAFNRVDGGFLRLDNQTGKIAFCSPQPIGWACQAVPEDRTALENEIARLQDEVASLKSELAALRELPPPPRPPADLTPPAPLPDKSEDTTKLREDLARARAAFESAWRRLVEIIVQLQKDMMRKG